jgi:glycosyltransferase involved in cell wall biosynthesis
MKVGVFISSYNRPEYLRETLDSLRLAHIPEGTEIIIVDDASTDIETLTLIKEYNYIRSNKNLSIRNSIQVGFEFLFSKGCDLVINLDSDTNVRADFIESLTNLHQRFPCHIITGFNCTTKNRNGRIRHHILSEGDGYNVKRSVGGVNMAANKEVYEKYIKPGCLKGGNWDHEACKISEADGKGIICAVPSVVQHIGFKSSMGHSNIEKPDVADDFKPLSLKNVTLVAIDCKDINRLLNAVDESIRHIEFGSVRVISSIEHPRVTDKIGAINSKEAYSEFCIKELHKYIETEYCLVIQYDGYVKNYKSWKNEFLNYDYIGAPWEWLEKRKVGNGGFSLRSKRIMELSSKIINEYHPEDYVICEKYADRLEREGIKFAPLEIARQFSIEGYRADKTYNNQFGFHGTQVKFKKSEWTNKVCVLQPFGLGDVIFCQTLMHLSFGNSEITWPVKEYFVDNLNRAYPYINFIPEHESPVDINTNTTAFVNGYKVVPIRWSDKNANLPYNKVMRAKYDMYKQDWKQWKRKAMWVRDLGREEDLFSLLGLEEKKYSLINTTFGTDFKGNIKLHKDGVHLRKIEGFSLFDWAKVIENAQEIHTVSTSILYIIDLLRTGNVHVYIRRPNERDHRNYSYIFNNKKYIYSSI